METKAELPPLPPGWTEHKAPSGHKYYYNTTLKKSTYTRPIPDPPKPEDQVSQAQTSIDESPEVKNTALIVDKAVSITEWSAEIAIESTREPAIQRAGRVSTEDAMWKQLEDRPRKK
jgi:WW domain